MRTNTLLILFILLCPTSILLGQSTDTAQFKLSLSLNGNITEGNLTRWILVNRINAIYQPAGSVLSIAHSDYYIYGRVQGMRFENNLLDRTFLNFNANKKLIPFIALFLESYPIRNQDFRWQTGVGIKFKVIDNKELLLQPALMISYSEQDFISSNFQGLDNGGSNEINSTFLTPTIRFNIPLLNNKIVLTNTFWYQIDLDGTTGNHRSFYDGKVIIKISKQFSFQLIVTNYWENVVQSVRGAGPQGPSIGKNDFLLSYGINFNLGQ